MPIDNLLHKIHFSLLYVYVCVKATQVEAEARLRSPWGKPSPVAAAVALRQNARAEAAEARPPRASPT